MLREQQIQSRLIKKLEKKGYYVIKLVKTNKNGIPDIIAIPKDSDVLFFEVKTKTGTAKPLQKFRLKELSNHGIKVYIHRGTR